MVAVAQSAERQIVALEVAGSSPVGHPRADTSALSADDYSIQGIFISLRFLTVQPSLAPSSVYRAPALVRGIAMESGCKLILLEESE